jgi:hypothetical protein
MMRETTTAKAVGIHKAIHRPEKPVAGRERHNLRKYLILVLNIFLCLKIFKEKM